jgi:electron transfer flavoprotein alpha subunit
MRVLVIAEHSQETCFSATDHAVTAAKQLTSDVDILIAGEGCKKAAERAATLEGVTQVLLADHGCYQHQFAESLSKLILTLAPEYDYFIAAATQFGKNLMPRVAALLNVAQLSDVVAIESADIFVRPLYAGNALEQVQLLDAKKVLTIRATAFSATNHGITPAPIKQIDTQIDWNKTRFIRQTLSPCERPDLTTARIIVSGGRGLQSQENFQLVERLADILGAAVGASRAAVDAGFAPNDYQVGQTGKVVAPQLYIAVGISGAIQHIAGMKDSKVIVAINQDPDATIFSYADYGLVGDLFEILPKLITALQNQ